MFNYVRGYYKNNYLELFKKIFKNREVTAQKPKSPIFVEFPLSKVIFNHKYLDNELRVNNGD